MQASAEVVSVTSRLGSSTAKGIEYRTQRVRTLLKPHDEGERRFWSVEPYEGCEFGCASCVVRLDRELFNHWREFETRVSVRVNAGRVLEHELRTQDLAGRPLLLGGKSDPWQPAEERFRITREVLEVMVHHGALRGGLEVHARTRSALVARDAELLGTLARRSRVVVSLAVASVDDALNRLVEPRAPPVAERLAALESLASAGVKVGLVIAPPWPGLTSAELGVAELLARAAEAGASFAGFQCPDLAVAQRERFARYARATSPELAELLARPTDERQPEVLAAFEARRASLGLASEQEVLDRAPRRRAAS